MHSKKCYNVDELVVMLGFSKSTIYRRISENKFPPPAKVGSRSVWPVAVIEKYEQRLAERGY